MTFAQFVMLIMFLFLTAVIVMFSTGNIQTQLYEKNIKFVLERPKRKIF